MCVCSGLRGDEGEAPRQKRARTHASPSAVRIWAERAGTAAAAICIGETSAVEARGVGFERVIFPEKPGVESWAECVVKEVGAE